MNTKKALILVVVGILFLLLSTYIAQVYNAAKETGTTPQYFSPPEEQNVGPNFTLVILAMVAGIVSQYMFEKSKKAGNRKINIKSILSKMVTNSRFIMAIVVSPLIFNSIFLVIGSNPQGVGDYLLAFQNGFFWQSIINGFGVSE